VSELSDFELGLKYLQVYIDKQLIDFRQQAKTNADGRVDSPYFG